jgi:L-cystine uptake protein TcyP (sodium:dicarboxylate symporter family)
MSSIPSLYVWPLCVASIYDPSYSIYPFLTPFLTPSFTTPNLRFLITNSLLIGIVGSIGLAAAYPPLGAVYLAPQITATYIAVMYIFLLSGISLKSSELGERRGGRRMRSA